MTCVSSRVLCPLQDGLELVGVQHGFGVVGVDGLVVPEGVATRLDAREESIGGRGAVRGLVVRRVGLQVIATGLNIGLLIMRIL